MLQSCYQHLGKNDEWAEFLRRAVEENTGAAAELMLADILEAREGLIPLRSISLVSCNVILRCACSTS